MYFSIGPCASLRHGNNLGDKLPQRSARLHLVQQILADSIVLVLAVEIWSKDKTGIFHWWPTRSLRRDRWIWGKKG